MIQSSSRRPNPIRSSGRKFHVAATADGAAITVETKARIHVGETAIDLIQEMEASARVTFRTPTLHAPLTRLDGILVSYSRSPRRGEWFIFMVLTLNPHKRSN